MPFLPPDQQRQSTEGTFDTIIMRLKLRMVVYVATAFMSVSIRTVGSCVLFVAGKQTVECDFEDTFMCGYMTSTVGTMSWKRVSGKVISRSTYDERGNDYR